MFFIKKIPIAINFLLDRDVPFRKKIWIILALVYTISPIDLIPDPVLGLGIIDDAVLITFVLNKLSSDLDKYVKDKERKEKEKEFKDKIIENVEYEIQDDEKE